MVVPRSAEEPDGPSPSSASWSPAEVLAGLAAEYPEVPGPVLAQALESAYLAAQTLGGAADVVTPRVVGLARDRLDVVRERALAAQRRVGLTPRE